jgi:hypothetical protein
VYKKRVKRDKFKIDRSDKGKEKRTFQGIVFDSEMELKFYRDYLLPLKEKGDIVSIILQPKFILQDKFKKYGRIILPIHYVGDFEVVWKDGRNIVYDVKGLPTQEARLKRKAFDYKYPDKTLEWIALSIKYGGWIEYDQLQKLRAKDKKDSKLE